MNLNKFDLESGLLRLGRTHKLNILIFVVSGAAFSFLILGRYGHYFSNSTTRLVILAVFALGGAVLLKATNHQKGWVELWLASLLFLTFSFKIASYLTDISTYPFSLGWSEGSRYYYASLFLSKNIYGFPVPLSVLHPSRYLMQAVPFLIPDSQIWSHRLWQATLWIGTTLATASLLARRLSIPDKLHKWMFIAWVFLFLLLGPVFYHLQISVILVLLIFDHRKFGQSLLAVLLASAWAGFSRVNWYPIPGLLATALYLLEIPVGKLSVWRYLIKPVAWIGIGAGIAFITQSLYVLLSGNPAEQFTSSFTSDLLWYRLFPNPTFRIGVLPAALFVSFPFLFLVIDKLKRRWNAYHLIRLLGLALILLVLFIGGIVVSTKIGGGSNLHNLDAFFVLLLVVTAYVFFGDFIPEHKDEQSSITTSWATTVGLTLISLLPIFLTITTATKMTPFNQAEVERALKRINRFVRVESEKGREVLFIDERQLLTFRDVENTKLVPDYEKVFLTEMAMAGNQAYLKRFHEDLKNQRFALIITEPLFIKYKGRSEPFGEENDAWAKHVSEPVLCYYKPAVFLPEVRLRIYEPREQPRECEIDTSIRQ